MEVELYNKLCKNKDTKIHMPKRKVNDDDCIVFFEENKICQLDDYFKGTNAETAYMLGKYCGLRINECYGLKWSDIDLKNGTIRICQQMQYQNGIIKLVPLKTRNAKRTIFMSQKLQEYLVSLYEKKKEAEIQFPEQRQQNQKFIIGMDGNMVSSLEMVNTLSNGKLQTVNSMKYHSRMIKEKYGFEFKYHYLRHTYGTMTNIDRVKRQLESMIPDAYRMEIDNSLVEYGISDMAISMNIDVKFKYAHDIQDIDGNIVETQEAVDCTPELNLEEIRAASYYSYRRYLIKLKDALNRDSMGIKTLTLEIKDMHKRVEAVDSLLLEVNRYINSIEGMKCLGKVVQFGK